MKFSLFVFVSSLLVNDGFAFMSGPSSVSKNKKPDLGKCRMPVTMLHETPKESSEQPAPKEKLKPIILEPCIAAMAPNYSEKGPVGGGGFLISRTGGPIDGELADENLYKIIDRTASDLEVNTLVWKCLGYRFDPEKEAWTPDEVFPKWKERFPDVPDVIGMRRVYSKDVDGPSLRNNQSLVKSIPVENKQSYLKEYMKPFGFTGYKVRNRITAKEASFALHIQCRKILKKLESDKEFCF